jgi:hypothetical protein
LAAWTGTPSGGSVMGTFRGYLKAQCEDPEFRKKYYEQCSICQRTALIIATVQERGLSKEAVAQGAGIELESLELLESADRCFPDDVRKLFSYLGLPDPGICRKAPK